LDSEDQSKTIDYFLEKYCFYTDLFEKGGASSITDILSIPYPLYERLIKIQIKRKKKEKEEFEKMKAKMGTGRHRK
jgi:hypothetical protein